jgi:hypothetical protein
MKSPFDRLGGLGAVDALTESWVARVGFSAEQEGTGACQIRARWSAHRGSPTVTHEHSEQPLSGG